MQLANRLRSQDPWWHQFAKRCSMLRYTIALRPLKPRAIVSQAAKDAREFHPPFWYFVKRKRMKRTEGPNQHISLKKIVQKSSLFFLDRFLGIVIPHFSLTGKGSRAISETAELCAACFDSS
jgi:hypothetical protein